MKKVLTEDDLWALDETSKILDCITKYPIRNQVAFYVILAYVDMGVYPLTSISNDPSFSNYYMGLLYRIDGNAEDKDFEGILSFLNRDLKNYFHDNIRRCPNGEMSMEEAEDAVSTMLIFLFSMEILQIMHTMQPEEINALLDNRTMDGDMMIFPDIEELSDKVLHNVLHNVMDKMQDLLPLEALEYNADSLDIEGLDDFGDSYYVWDKYQEKKRKQIRNKAEGRKVPNYAYKPKGKNPSKYFFKKIGEIQEWTIEDTNDINYALRIYEGWLNQARKYHAAEVYDYSFFISIEVFNGVYMFSCNDFTPRQQERHRKLLRQSYNLTCDNLKHDMYNWRESQLDDLKTLKKWGVQLPHPKSVFDIDKEIERWEKDLGKK